MNNYVSQRVSYRELSVGRISSISSRGKRDVGSRGGGCAECRIFDPRRLFSRIEKSTYYLASDRSNNKGAGFENSPDSSYDSHRFSDSIRASESYVR